jgi:serine protease Do
MKEGDTVMAMGSPYGFTRSISKGIISSTERYFEFSPYNLWFQTDAAINPGNSGGPLVNEKGEVIGVNTLGLSGMADNIGFAVPSEVVKEVVEKLGRDKKVTRAWFGIRLQALKDFSKSSILKAQKGVLVASVDEGSPAEKAGMKAGDVLINCNDRELNGIYQTDLPAIERYMANLPVGVPAKLTIQRSQTRTVEDPFSLMALRVLKMIMPKMPVTSKMVTKEIAVLVTPSVKEKHEGDDFECKKWNMTVKEITKFAEPYIYFQRSKGVYIQGIKSGGNAETSGLAHYDILMKIGGTEIDSLKTLKEVYEKLASSEKGKRKVLVTVLREGYPQYVVLDYERDIEKIEDE